MSKLINKQQTVACPCCRRQQPYRAPDSLYWCENCRGQFDAEGDDGGTYSDQNPAARIEREERHLAHLRAGGDACS